MTTQITGGVKVSVRCTYQPQQSNPANGHFVFTYHVHIENRSNYSVQLMSRQWHLFDSDNTQRIVKGEGVVGLQPIIEPGQHYEYVSGSNLKTDMGTMTGFYTMKRLVDGEIFKVSIPKFFLIASFRLN